MNVKQRTVFVVAALLMLLSAGCTDYNLEDTGLADGNHNTTMLEYFKGDPYNFDSLQVMIRHAGLEDIFEGKSQYGNNITCFGITNHSIRRYMLENEITSIQDMPVDECRRMVLDCVTAQRIMLDDVPEGAPSTDLETPIGTGERLSPCSRVSGCGYILTGIRTTMCLRPDQNASTLFQRKRQKAVRWHRTISRQTQG